jgi:thiol-disulfide isomerase/thioredoxin
MYHNNIKQMKFTEIFYNNFYRPNKRNLLIGVTLVVFLSVGTYIFATQLFPVIRKKMSTENTTDIPNATRRTKPLEIYFFNADWCPHCVSAKPDWKSFVSKYDKSDKNGYTIDCIGGEDGVNCTDSDSNAEITDQINKFNVKHFPTIKMKKDGEIIDYDAKVTTSNLEAFINTVVA